MIHAARNKSQLAVYAIYKQAIRRACWLRSWLPLDLARM
jgi:hypothetical protein